MTLWCFINMLIIIIIVIIIIIINYKSIIKPYNVRSLLAMQQITSVFVWPTRISFIFFQHIKTSVHTATSRMTALIGGWANWAYTAGLCTQYIRHNVSTSIYYFINYELLLVIMPYFRQTKRYTSLQERWHAEE